MWQRLGSDRHRHFVGVGELLYAHIVFAASSGFLRPRHNSGARNNRRRSDEGTLQQRVSAISGAGRAPAFDSYESQIAALNGQISALVAMKSTCQQLGTDFQGVVTKISGIRNSGDFLASDILTINTDLDAGSALSVIGIMVKAAITQVTTLGVDAS
jgi:hypothetical protein